MRLSLLKRKLELKSSHYILQKYYRKSGDKVRETSKYGAKRLVGLLKTEKLKERRNGLEHLNLLMT